LLVALELKVKDPWGCALELHHPALDYVGAELDDVVASAPGHGRRVLVDIV